MSQPVRRKRRRRNRVPTPILWIVTVLCGGLFAFGIFEIMVRVVHPYQLGHQQAQKVADLKDRLKRQAEKNAGLQKEVDFLQSEEGAETLARSEGYHRRNETVFLVAPR